MPSRSLATLACLLVLGACAQQPAAPTSADAAAPQAAPQAQASAGAGEGRGARARTCDAPNIGRNRPAAGGLIIMTLSNEGGWCAKSLDRNGLGFTGGNVVEAPGHGEARLRHMPSRTLVEYRPQPGYAGSDRFTVALTPGNRTYIVEATVRP